MGIPKTNLCTWSTLAVRRSGGASGAAPDSAGMPAASADLISNYHARRAGYPRARRVLHAGRLVALPPRAEDLFGGMGKDLANWIGI